MMMTQDKLTRRVSFWVRHFAGKRGIALAHLADRAGIGRTTMWRLLDVNERGPSDPRLSTVAALATALGVEPQSLMEPIADEN
jgi:DNA-binding phage protein